MPKMEIGRKPAGRLEFRLIARLRVIRQFVAQEVAEQNLRGRAATSYLEWTDGAIQGNLRERAISGTQKLGRNLRPCLGDLRRQGLGRRQARCAERVGPGKFEKMRRKTVLQEAAKGEGGRKHLLRLPQREQATRIHQLHQHGYS